MTHWQKRRHLFVGYKSRLLQRISLMTHWQKRKRVGGLGPLLMISFKQRDSEQNTRTGLTRF